MKLWKSALAVTVILTSNPANAALFERLGGLAYYDDVADLTWLADANAAGTSMSFYDANRWAYGLTVGGVDGWRLPSIDNTNSEMRTLFSDVLGGSFRSSISTTHNANYDLFSNIDDQDFWTSQESEYSLFDAINFSMADGYATFNDKRNGFYAWAVYSGDVSPVPVPAAVWLFGSGLVGLAGLARRKR